jgi:solute carrier family 25, member 33/36
MIQSNEKSLLRKETPHSTTKPHVHGGLHFLAGAIGGATSAIILSPLDIIRTRLQSSRGHAAHVNARTMFANIVRNEGVFALWRGLIPTIFGVGPARSLYFGCYAVVKRQLGPEGYGLEGPPLHFFGSAIAGIFSNTVMSPWWVIRLRLQLQQTPIQPLWGKKETITNSNVKNNMEYSGVIDAFRKIYREEGWRAFYRGLSASYLGVIETVLQFTIYGELKRIFLTPSIINKDSTSSTYFGSHSYAFGLSACSKLAASILTYPHEVLRTRMREEVATPGTVLKYRGLLQSAHLILKEEGIAGLYGGMGVHLLRTVPNAAILLFVVETIVGGDV